MPAKRMAMADILAQAYQQGMVLIEQTGISRQILHKQGLVGSIVVRLRCRADTIDDAAGISVDNKNRLICRI